jgi:hypothetical protein
MVLPVHLVQGRDVALKGTTSLNSQPKTRAERAFHLVKRALLRMLLAGKA